MLTPDDRQLFLEALKPPGGYQFDRGIGTTFTLDLIALLVTPLSLSFLDGSSIDEALQDPLIILEGLRRAANHLTIFCQAGYIAVPPKDNYLYRYLEDIIVEVKAPGTGVFHPKVWLLRYVSKDLPTIYRFLNLSRNLTFDRSWDLILQMDGEVADRQVGYARNRPLSDFLATLPNLALGEVPIRIKNDIDLLTGEVRKVNFRIPPGFEDYLEFYPSGIPGYRSYQFSNNFSRMLIISPFLSNQFLTKVTKQGDSHILVSNVSSIDELPRKSRSFFNKLYVLDDLADSDSEDPSLTFDKNNQVDLTLQKNYELYGLHAKLFVLENGWDARWLIGSANATDAAFKGHNVEFMVELLGKKSNVGINKIVSKEDTELSLRTLLKPYPEIDQPKEKNASEKKAEEVVDSVRKYLIATNLSLDIQETREFNYHLILTGKEVLKPPDGEYSITSWPISLSESNARKVDVQKIIAPIEFSDLTILSITPLLAFEVEAKVDNAKYLSRFVLNIPIHNLPLNRSDYIISAIIEDQGQFLRYLRILLAGEETSFFDLNWSKNGWPHKHPSSWENLDMPLLEDLVRALSRSPDGKINRIAEVVEQLKGTKEGKQIIPELFDDLWRVILHARAEIL